MSTSLSESPLSEQQFIDDIDFEKRNFDDSETGDEPLTNSISQVTPLLEQFCVADEEKGEKETLFDDRGKEDILIENRGGEETIFEDRKPFSMIEPLEIERAYDNDGAKDTVEEEDDDFEALLGDGLGISMKSKNLEGIKKKSCCNGKRVGNVIILCPGFHGRTGYGIVGPHWFGPFCVLFVIGWASDFFIRRAMKIGLVSTIICILFSISCVYHLLSTCFRDPGVVIGKPGLNEDISEYRWCDLCNVYQPPDGAHCPDCNVCIAGYDHHCVWMGVCIGKKNMKPFIRFNLSWLLYLLYCVLWVSILGPLLGKFW